MTRRTAVEDAHRVGPAGHFRLSRSGRRLSGAEIAFRLPRCTREAIATYAADGDSFRANRPHLMSETTFALRRSGTTLRNLDLHPDGQRFAIAPGVERSAVKADRVVFIFNFFDELRRIAPTNEPMTLASGTRLGPYEITSAIGAGGMGEGRGVSRAGYWMRPARRRLKREVAIKILPDSFATDPARIARFGCKRLV